MSYLALYRKYRPKSFKDLVGQYEVVNIIKNEILNDKISHAYLFSGPRGTGKTSTAKIIARMLNCYNLSDDGIPCGKCESCINFNNNSDIVEIDAASNNGVDEIRELRDKVNLVPTFGKYKIYIIDEVHMLTTQAFNALLKTLEEPPSHVIFILATTEFYKIPITVVSRCQKFQFLKFSIEEIVLKLKEIALAEKITVSDEVLYEISRLSDGGLRDAINMLDQLSSFKQDELSIDDVYALNGVVSYSEFKTLLFYMNDQNMLEIINFIEEIDKKGKSLDKFIEDFIVFLKDILVYKNTGTFFSNIDEKNENIKNLSSIYDESIVYKLILLLNDLCIKTKSTSFIKIMLITELIRFSNDTNEDIKQIVNNENDLNTSNNNELLSNDLPKKVITKNSKITDKIIKIRINNSFATASKDNKEFFLEKWSDVLEKLSNDLEYNSIAGMMTDVEVLVVGKKNVMFMAQYDSLIERLFFNIDLIEKLLYSVYNIDYKVVFLLKDEWEFEKKKYIDSLKNGDVVKYTYVNEDNTFTESIVDDDEKKIISIFGNDIIKYQ